MENLKEYYGKEKTFNRVLQNFIESADINSKSEVLDDFSDEEMDRIMPVAEYYFKQGLINGIDFCLYLKGNK